MPSAPRPSLTSRWNHEWDRLCLEHDRHARRQAWPGADGEPGGLAGVLAAIGGDRSRTQDTADADLARLIGFAAHDEVAARTVLQRLLPGLVSIATRRSRGFPGRRRALFDELVATSWLLVRTYPLDRRPARIAANLLLDAEYHTCVRPFRLRSGSEAPTPRMERLDQREATLDGRDDRRPSTPGEEALALLALGARRGVVSLDDARLLAQLYLGSRPMGEVAGELGVSVRTVYNRRESATSRLAAFAAG